MTKQIQAQAPIPEPLWLQFKSLASARGLSVKDALAKLIADEVEKSQRAIIE